jgi:hypothetical protein
MHDAVRVVAPRAAPEILKLLGKIRAVLTQQSRRTGQNRRIVPWQVAQAAMAPRPLK